MSAGTYYAVTVYEDRGDIAGLFDVRTVTATLWAAKRFVDAETQRVHGSTPTWQDEFGGSRGQLKGLVYDIRPVRTALP